MQRGGIDYNDLSEDQRRRLNALWDDMRVNEPPVEHSVSDRLREFYQNNIHHPARQTARQIKRWYVNNIRPDGLVAGEALDATLTGLAASSLILVPLSIVQSQMEAKKELNKQKQMKVFEDMGLDIKRIADAKRGIQRTKPRKTMKVTVQSMRAKPLTNKKK